MSEQGLISNQTQDTTKEEFKKYLRNIYEEDTIKLIMEKNITIRGDRESNEEQLIHYTNIERYNIRRNYKNSYTANLSDTIKAIQTYSRDKINKLLEMTHISKSYFRMFFDLEGEFEESLI